MSTIEPFWRFLETRPSHAAVMSEWRTVAGDHLAAIRPLLMASGRQATVYPDPRGGRALGVVRHRDGALVAVDGSDWQHRVSLKDEDVVLYQLDMRAVRKVLCDAIDCLNIVKSPIDMDGGCAQVGNWEPKKAASFPVYILLSPTRAELRRQILDLPQRRSRSGAILLTPTRINWDGDLDDLARGARMLLVAVSEIVEPEGDGFRQTAAWEEYLQAFCQMVQLTLPGNYRNKKPTPMRGSRAVNIEKLEKALEAHLVAAHNHAHSFLDQGMEPFLLPRPDQKLLAKLTGLTESDVSRCMNDPRARLLSILWATADSLDAVLKYKRRR